MGDAPGRDSKPTAVPNDTESEFSKPYNDVSRTVERDSDTDTTAVQNSALFDEAYPPPGERVVASPSDPKVYVDGQLLPRGSGDVNIERVENLTVVYPGADGRDPRIARVEDGGDYVGTNYPDYNYGEGRLGQRPYFDHNGDTFHALRRGQNNVVIRADIGDRDYDHRYRNPRYEFGHSRGNPRYDHGSYRTPPFFPPHGGEPRISIGIGNRGGGGLQIGGFEIGGIFSIGGNNRGGYDRGGYERGGWNQGGRPDIDIRALIDTGSNNRYTPDCQYRSTPYEGDYNQGRNQSRSDAHRQRFQDAYSRAREQSRRSR
ncbi:MAG: hypothetical protein SGJ27_08580 [Candidatus Melainabacteria bacterium]|nr:hypothetical protein [Candidatus Melainabacteria bacterium]